MAYSDREINKVEFGSPHVVILGAGASVAAFPNGDAFGKKLPLMNNFIDLLGIQDVLSKFNVKITNDNFEKLYSDLCKNKNNKELIKEIEKKVAEYFYSLRMKDQPTLYDHLVLSLREKDLIATFNWDPLLFSACYKNHKITKLPHVVYLHGNIAIGYCLKDKIKGSVKSRCSKCKEPFIPTPLLFPIEDKDYTNNPFIKTEWDTLRNYLSKAYIVTVFGYSAPETDKGAICLMKEAWGKKELPEFEAIDIKNTELLEANWKDFTYSHHNRTTDNFYASILGRYPRRSCEAIWSSLMELEPYSEANFPREAKFEELYDWYKPIFEAEIKGA